MSESDQVGDGPRPDEKDWAEVVDEATQLAAAHDEEEEPAPAKEVSKEKLLMLLMVPLVVAMSWSAWTLTRPVPPLEPQAQEASLAGVLFILAQQLDRHQAETGVYPTSLDEVSPPLGDITYRLEGDGYVLEARANDVELTYGSWEDAGGLLALAGSPALQELSR